MVVKHVNGKIRKFKETSLYLKPLLFSVALEIFLLTDLTFNTPKIPKCF